MMLVLTIMWTSLTFILTIMTFIAIIMSLIPHHHDHLHLFSLIMSLFAIAMAPNSPSGLGHYLSPFWLQTIFFMTTINYHNNDDFQCNNHAPPTQIHPYNLQRLNSCPYKTVWIIYWLITKRMLSSRPKSGILERPLSSPAGVRQFGLLSKFLP